MLPVPPSGAANVRSSRASMSHTEARASARHSPFVRAAGDSESASLLLLAVLGIVLFTMLRSPLKDDVAWLLYVARRWLAGRELYVDVVEINPPLIVWISAIPMWLAGVLGIDAQYTAIPFFVAAVLACAWWTASLLQGSGKLFEDRAAGVRRDRHRAAGGSGRRSGSARASSGAAILPYLALFARSLDGERPPLRDALIAGVLAGLGCALKPRYAGVFVVLEGLALLRGLQPVPRQGARCRRDDAGLCRTGRVDLPCVSAPRGAAGTGAVRRDRRAAAAPGG